MSGDAPFWISLPLTPFESVSSNVDIASGVKIAVAHQMRVFGSAGICDRFPDICTECDACVLPSAPLTTDGAPAAAATGDASAPMTQDDTADLIKAVTHAVLEGLKQQR